MKTPISSQRYRPAAIALIIAAMLAAAGCATVPNPPDNPRFIDSAATRSKDNVNVSVAVLTDDEAEEYFGCPLAKEGIQAVWLKVENHNRYPIGLLSRSMDPEYFSAFEVSYLNHRAFSDDTNHQLDEFFRRVQFPTFVSPGATESGFVFTSRQEGVKFVNVEFWHGAGLTRDGFFMTLAGGGFDFHESDFGKMYTPAETRALSLSDLHEKIEKLPCCTTNRSGSKSGDPVNFVLVGSEDDVLGTLTQQGWDATQSIGTESVGKTVSSFLFGGRYRYSPISRLYFFGRGQDLAMQKVRETIHQRNHLRLWRSPYTYQGQEVWIGQISRDVGVRFTWQSPTLVTHKIDPEVDEARDYLVQDMVTSGFLASMGYTHGVAVAPRESPRRNLTGDPYFTDGLRAVMFISSKPVPIDQITLIEWPAPLPTD
jgi:hypothetical protein